MTLHLIKLSVGTDSLQDLAQWQKGRLADMKARGQKPELIHVTRQMPKRAADIEGQGSIYWVIQGWIVARQPVVELRALTRNGIPHCGIVLGRKLVPVQWQQRRAFQGWRYLDPKDAPPDSAAGSGHEALPQRLREELAALGLL